LVTLILKLGRGISTFKLIFGIRKETIDCEQKHRRLPVIGTDAATQKLWKYFEDLTNIPRPSQGEQAVIEYLKKFAEDRGLESRIDSYGNIAIMVPGKNCSSDAKRIILQGHVDMVCDARPGVQIDFAKDPIKTKIEGDLMKAEGTTLGADNGIGVAASLAILDELDSYPPLNLLFTVDEERGLHGAAAIEPPLLEGDILLNLDGEDFGYFFIGCAGGADISLETEITTEEKEVSLFELSIANLKGGHSGVDIHLNRKSANKLLFNILGNNLIDQIQFAEIQTGRAHNIIARDGFVRFSFDGAEKDLINHVNNQIDKIEANLDKDDEKVEFELKQIDKSMTKLCSKEETQKLYRFITLHPHGAEAIDWSFESPVTKSSVNLAKIIMVNGKLHTLTSYRFNDPFSGEQLREKLKTFYRAFNFAAQFSKGYPSWAPNWESEILDRCKSVFIESFSSEENIQVTAMHAGLECGILLDKKPELDAISFGPDIRNAHSPDEYVSISSVEKFWKYLSDLLKNLAKA
jgi:dipeptidase D